MTLCCSLSERDGDRVGPKERRRAPAEGQTEAPLRQPATAKPPALVSHSLGVPGPQHLTAVIPVLDFGIDAYGMT